ncbi:MAG TPA: hypothetical protein VGR19_12780 [Allosphingosinicella sp.]|nr:hypothetical protein [Allosphingosinicella sp.]
MNALTKSLLGAGAAALATLTAAAPAQAQYYPYPDQRQGVDLGAIARGVATAGAVAAVVGAITNATRGGTYGGGYGNRGVYGNGTYGNGGYGYPSQGAGYGYGSQNFERAAVDACGSQAQRYGRVSIDNVELRSRSTVRVRGMIEANAGGYGGYGSYGGGIERRTFDCSFRSDGRITNFDTGRVRY